MISHLNPVMPHGLTSDEAVERRHRFGTNEIPEERPRLLLAFLRKFTGPVPYMLEGTLLLQLLLGKHIDGAIIALALVVNGIISFAYERKAQGSLALLQQRLTIQTRVLRDREWQLVQASELVPGDIIRLRVGDLVPADVQLIDGQIAVDQSMLTGESNLVQLCADSMAYAASVIKRGEALAEIKATGMHTSYSQTAKLVQTAKSNNHGDLFVQKVVTYLMGLTAILVAVVLIYAFFAQLPMAEVLLFTLALLIAAIPVSLPVTFTLATAVGSRELAQQGVLTTRLSAIKEAAGMDILCSDKTGTLTKNELTLVGTRTYNTYGENDLLRFAAYACDEANYDPIDIAIVKAARDANTYKGTSKRLEFVPFAPETKRTEALMLRRKHKLPMRVIKGAPHIINQIIRDEIDLTADVEELVAGGNRCIAIAKGREGKAPKLVGLLALQDPPRDDAATVVTRLQELGVQVLMVTGDGLATARLIAHKVGIISNLETTNTQRKEVLQANFDVTRMNCSIFANVYPEDKYNLVKALQKAGHVVGMTGDGINDAPAIKQAEIGVAVSNATDITKSAASFVLTDPGLKDMLAAVMVGRQIFQRMSTYILNKIIKTIHLGLFLSIGLLATGMLIANPTHILLVVLANDLVSMALTTDRVRPSLTPNRWQVGPMVKSGLIVALAWVAFSFATFYYGRDLLRLDAGQLQTLIFLMMVLVAQANVYLIRERTHFWNSRPSHWMILATTVGLTTASLLALQGILMAPIGLPLLLQICVATLVFALLLDLLKVKTFRYYAVT